MTGAGRAGPEPRRRTVRPDFTPQNRTSRRSSMDATGPAPAVPRGIHEHPRENRRHAPDPAPRPVRRREVSRVASALKGVGLLLTVVAVLVLLAGLAAAGFGYVDENENQEALLADPERSGVNEDLMVYGLVAAGGAIAVLLVGIILTVAGGSASQQAATPGRGRTGWLVAAVALALVAALVMVSFTGSGTGSGPAFLHGGARERLLEAMVFEGRVQDAYSTPVQSGTTDASGSTRQFQAPAGAARGDVELTWTPEEQGTSNLRLILEVQEGGSWRELDRVAGPGPLSLSLEDRGLDGATLRYRVFANDDAGLVLEQDFQVQVRFYGTR